MLTPLLVWAAAFSLQQPPQQQGAERADSTQRDSAVVQKAAPPFAPQLALDSAATAQRDSERQAGEASNREKRVNTFLSAVGQFFSFSFADLVVAAATFALAVVAFQQKGNLAKQEERLNATVTALEAQKTEMGRMAEAMEDTARRSAESLSAQQRHAQMTLRAYVGLEVTEIGMIGPDLVTRLVFKNTGQTTALDCRVTALYTTAAHPNLGPEGLPDTTVNALGPRSPLFPTCQIVKSVKIEKFDRALELGRLRAGHAVYLHGELVYQDVFGDGHRTTFRSVLDPEHLQFLATAEGNEAT